MVLQSPEKPIEPAQPTVDDVDAGVIKDARKRQHRERRIGASLIIAGVVVGGLIIGSAGGVGGSRTTDRHQQPGVSAATRIPMRNGQIAYQIEGWEAWAEVRQSRWLRSAVRDRLRCVGRRLRIATISTGPAGSLGLRMASSSRISLGRTLPTGHPTSLRFTSSAPNGDHLRRLTVCGQCEGVSWSPDGSQIAVARYAGPRGDGTANLWVVNARNGAMRQVTHCQSEPVCRTAGYLAYFDPEWSPTGQAILFTRIGKNGEGRFVYMVRPDGSDLTEPKNLRNRAGAQVVAKRPRDRDRR